MKTRYLLYCDSHGTSGYFHGCSFIFWTCGSRPGAKVFTSRAAAVKVLQANGKHKQGWRVITERDGPKGSR